MAIYMSYGKIKGSVTTDGFKDWIELHSFQWGVNRAIGSAARSMHGREHSEPSLSEVTVTKVTDAATPDLLLDAVAGQLNNDVTIKLTTTIKAKVETFLTFKLENTGISHYSLSSGGDNPMESLALNFTKITETYVAMDPGRSGGPKSVGYDLTKMSSF